MQRPYALLLEDGGHSALPQECIARIEERLKWAEEVCRGAWIGSNDKSTTIRTSPLQIADITSAVAKQDRIDEQRHFKLIMLAMPAMAIFCFAYVNHINHKYDLDVCENRSILQNIRDECQRKIRDALEVSDRIIKENQSRTFRPR